MGSLGEELIESGLSFYSKEDTNCETPLEIAQLEIPIDTSSNSLKFSFNTEADISLIAQIDGLADASHAVSVIELEIAADENGVNRFSTGTLASCAEYKDSSAYTDQGNGLYAIDVDGSGAQPELTVFCDMESTITGAPAEDPIGGWTLITAQFDSDPMTDWGEGTAAATDYDPTLATSKSFAFNSDELPAFSELAFGKINGGVDGTIEILDSLEFAEYTGAWCTDPGNEACDSQTNGLILTGITGATYRVARLAAGVYSQHDPRNTVLTSSSYSVWHNTLTFELKEASSETSSYNWSFSPNHSTQRYRGYGYDGSTHSSTQSHAWVLMVR